jgi:DNA-binding response OmpR family regulator
VPCIVILESDDLMRGLLVEWLSAEGYAVHAWDGPSPDAPRHPDLVIVDVYMPRHLGVETLRSVQCKFPGVPIIAISGQFGSGLRGDGTAACALGVRQVIAKPFGRAQLLKAVRAATPSG